MNFRNCFVEIPEGREITKDGATYVEVGNGNFSIKLKTFCTPKIATITFQGINQGEFVLEPGVSYEAIERSIKNHERFAVYDYNSPEASKMGKDGYTKDELGLIEVKFYEVNRRVQPLVAVDWTYTKPYIWPDTWPYYITCKDNTARSYTSSCATSYTFGSNSSVIGTEGKSNQYFGTSDKYDIDYSKQPIVLYLRLVPEKEDKVKPLVRNSGCIETPYPKCL